MSHLHRALSDCPVCGADLVTTRLGCSGCGTELVGQFAPCAYCALDDADHDLLRVFLTSRGNLKDLQAHLGVSYPTARARFNDVLARLGWLSEADAEGADEADGAEAIDEEDAAGEPDGSHSDASHASESQPGATNDAVRDQVLAQVASGALAPDVAADLLRRLR